MNLRAAAKALRDLADAIDPGPQPVFVNKRGELEPGTLKKAAWLVVDRLGETKAEVVVRELLGAGWKRDSIRTALSKLKADGLLERSRIGYYRVRAASSQS